MADMKQMENEGGSFTEGNIPHNTFPLEGDVFLSSTTFKNHVLIHVRKFNKYGNQYYPSKEGISLTPYQFANVVSNDYLREKSTDKSRSNPLFSIFGDESPTMDPVIILSSTSVKIEDKRKRDCMFTIEFTDNVILKKEQTARSGQKFLQTVTLNNEQWNALFGLRDFMMDSVCDLIYQKLSIQKLFEMNSRVPVPKEGGDSGIMHELSFIFRQELYKALAEQNLLNPHQVQSFELCNNTLQHFNCAAINLNLFNIVKCFYETVKSKQCIHLVTNYFFINVNIVELLQIAREEFVNL